MLLGRGQLGSPGSGRASPYLNRGFPRRTRLRRHPLTSFSRVDHDMHGHWRAQTNMRGAQTTHLVRHREWSNIPARIFCGGRYRWAKPSGKPRFEGSLPLRAPGILAKRRSYRRQRRYHLLPNPSHRRRSRQWSPDRDPGLDRRRRFDPRPSDPVDRGFRPLPCSSYW
jgi:hypothetical protein